MLEATTISNPGEPIKAALRKGPVVVIALRHGPGIREPLYAIYSKNAQTYQKTSIGASKLSEH
jgi:hypothetical protein